MNIGYAWDVYRCAWIIAVARLGFVYDFLVS